MEDYWDLKLKVKCMVIEMNKKEFLNELSRQTDLNESEAILVNDILEKNFFISKKNKDKIISELIIKLDISLDRATVIYDISKNIISNAIMNKLKQPFKIQD